METEEIVKVIKRDKIALTDWRKKAKISYDYYAGEQWSDEDKAILEENNRPPIVFNRIARTVNSVVGLEIQNRQEVRYIPRDQGDIQVNELLTGTAEWVRDGCDAEDEESESFQDMMISGVGWTETRIDYELDAEGKIVIDRVDPMEMGWDHRSKKKNFDDSKHVWRVRELSKAEYDEKWPNTEPTPSMFWLEDDLDPHDATQAKNYENNQIGESEHNTIPVIQFQWYELETYHKAASNSGVVEIHKDKFVNGEGQVSEIDKGKSDRLIQFLEGSGLKFSKLKKRVYKQVFISGGDELERTDAPSQEGFSFRAMTGLRDRNNGYWLGLVSLMIDPQQWANKWLSQIMYILNTNAKGGLLAEQGAFQNPRQAEDDWAKSDSIIWLNSGGMGKVTERQMSQYPDGVDRLLQYAMDSINDVPGVSQELLGLADRNQPGYLEAHRKQAGVTILAVFFDALRRYRKEQGRLLADFIREYISDGRLVRINGEQSKQYVPLMKSEISMKYDIIVDDAPTSPNMKDRIFAIMMQLLPNMTQMGVPFPPEFLDYTPLPEGLTQKWKEMMQPTQPDPIQQEAQRLELEKAALANQETQSKVVLNHAKAQQAQAIARDEIAQALQKQGLTQIEADAKIDALFLDQQRKDIEFANDQKRKDIAFINDQQRKTAPEA